MSRKTSRPIVGVGLPSALPIAARSRDHSHRLECGNGHGTDAESLAPHLLLLKVGIFPPPPKKVERLAMLNTLRAAPPSRSEEARTGRTRRRQAHR